MSKANKYWTDSWNPSTGCNIMSEGCYNCYAEKMHKRLQGMGLIKYTSSFYIINDHEQELKRQFKGKNKIIFVNSMSDLFVINRDDNYFYEAIWYNIKQHPQHTFLICTKRPENISSIISNNVLDNIWMGVTIEMSKYAHRIDILRKNWRGYKWISFEPLLEHIYDIDNILRDIDWVVAGGETGNKARHCSTGWLYEIASACQRKNIPFFMKQFGKNSNLEIDNILSFEEILKNQKETPKEWRRV